MQVRTLEKIRKAISTRGSVGLFLPASLGLLVLALSPFAESLSPALKLTVAATGLLACAVGITGEMLVYLQANRASFSARKANDELEQTVSRLEAKMRNFDAQAMPTVLTQDDVNEVKAALTKNLTSDAVRAMVLELQSDALNSQIRLSVRRFQRQSDERLRQEISDLGRRANLNLVIGFFISFLGLSLLAYFVYTTNVELDNPQLNVATVATRFLVRLSLVVVVEVFAYFFLRLYRYSLFEIKYFQNELTNIEMKNIALTTAILSQDEDTAAKIALELVKTERNFILKKGESTLTLRKEEMENAYDLATISRLEQFCEKLNVAGRTK